MGQLRGKQTKRRGPRLLFNNKSVAVFALEEAIKTHTCPQIAMDVGKTISSSKPRLALDSISFAQN